MRIPVYSDLYILRHATPATSNVPNQERPLSEIGQRQAEALVPYLVSLDLRSVYTSPYKRALDSVLPFCRSIGVEPIKREGLVESGRDEELPEVRSRLIGAIEKIAGEVVGERALVCTHGGCLWGTISYFDPSFGYEDYKGIRTPDMRRVVFENGTTRLDTGFNFPGVAL